MYMRTCICGALPDGEFLLAQLGFLLPVGDWIKPVSEEHIAVGAACRDTPGLRFLQIAPPGMHAGR